MKPRKRLTADKQEVREVRKKYIAYKLCRAASIAVSAVGFVVMDAAGNVTDQRLFYLQFLLGLITFLCGPGYYMAFRYMELYQREHEKRARERQLRMGA